MPSIIFVRIPTMKIIRLKLNRPGTVTLSLLTADQKEISLAALRRSKARRIDGAADGLAFGGKLYFWGCAHVETR